MVITSIPAGPMTVTGRHAYFQLFAFDPRVRVIAVVYLLISYLTLSGQVQVVSKTEIAMHGIKWNRKWL